MRWPTEAPERTPISAGLWCKYRLMGKKVSKPPVAEGPEIGGFLSNIGRKAGPPVEANVKHW